LLASEVLASSQSIQSHRFTNLHLLGSRPEDGFQRPTTIGVNAEERVTEVNQTGLCHVTVDVRMPAVLLCVTAVVTERAMLQ
jgi:hypothetical protein